MTHFSEGNRSLEIKTVSLKKTRSPLQAIDNLNDVCILILPLRQSHSASAIDTLDPDFQHFTESLLQRLGRQATLIALGDTINLVRFQAQLSPDTHYQLWIAIKRATPIASAEDTALPQHHFGALVYTKYSGSLQHVKTRIEYTYCPACEKTTKDYGGKKHTYHSRGTLISDVWRDIQADLEKSLEPVISRFADLFAIADYHHLQVLDCRHWLDIDHTSEQRKPYTIQASLLAPPEIQANQSRLILGDALEELRKLPSNSVDFAFADPPYNLKKKYDNYSDDRSIAEYFNWCDTWMSELARVLRPGRTCAILNIPLWDIRHFLHLEKILRFQNWIAWDALSFPVRLIMPAHYGILCFSKGAPRKLPGLVSSSKEMPCPNSDGKPFHPLHPLAEGYCLRLQCVRQRTKLDINDRAQLTDLWWDIHRLKHNSRRVDHPCQLPPQLMYRLISLFTEPQEIVLDCFNGAGTTTLAAHQLNRQYLGIEISEEYHELAQMRHAEVAAGLDPFRKVQRELTAKNSPVERRPKQVYQVPKKTLQLEVRRVAKLLDKLPSRDEMIAHGKYPIAYYDRYFASWGEVCAAARHEGMSEVRRTDGHFLDVTTQQLSLFE